MAKAPTAEEVRTALHYLDIFQAIQKDTRTPGWYRGEVRGREAIGPATDALVRKGLIQSASGSLPFRLTKKGREFIEAQIKDWQRFMTKIARPGEVEKFAKALGRIAGKDK